MHECTIPDGETPTTRIRGKTGSKYILGIDPSFSNSPTSDYFAMSILELDDETKSGTLVHSYAVAGGDLKDHIRYLHYLVKNFDFEMIIIDNAGYQFIDGAVESKDFKQTSTKLEFLDFDSNKEGEDYNKQLKNLRNSLNKESGKIVFKQNFTSEFIRKANEHLQACIDHKRIWFASRTTANGSEFDKASNTHINLKQAGENSILDLIEHQDEMIYQTKKQCTLVEVKSTAKGSQTFDLPQHLKRSTSANKARKDNYTTLMLANWATKVYYDMQNVQIENINSTFEPKIFR